MLLTRTSVRVPDSGVAGSFEPSVSPRGYLAHFPASVSITNMAESELNVDSLISRLLEGTVPLR